MTWLLNFVWAFALSILFPSVVRASTDDFQNPPIAYRPKFRYWWPDASVDPEVVSKDINSLAAAGSGGLEFLPFYLYGLIGNENNPVTPTNWSEYGFGTPAFSSAFKKALEATDKAKILMDFAVGGSEGQGVPSEPMTPGLAVELLMGNITVNSGVVVSRRVPPPEKPSDSILNGLGFMHALQQWGTPNLTAVIAFQVSNGQPALDSSKTVRLVEDSFVDLTPNVRNMTLSWRVPPGNSTWKIFSFWQRYTNERSIAGGHDFTGGNVIANGSWTIDHFSKTGAQRVTDFWDQNILSDSETAQLLKTVGNYAWEDSMEIMATLYWTPGLLERFNGMMGYSLTKYLPLLFDGSNSWGGNIPPYSQKYTFDKSSNQGPLRDYRDVLNAGYREYSSHFVQWAHSNGFKYSNQPAYNLPLQMLEDIPLVDAPEGESLGFGDNIDAYRQFAGPSHLYGKNVVSTEVGAVRVPAYSQTVPDLLSRIRRSLAGGFTMSVIHGFPYSGNYPNTTWPGYTTFFYEFTNMWNQIQPCWQHMKDALDYIGRNQYVLQQGTPTIDLAFYLFEAPWSPRTQYSLTDLTERGFTYDYLGPENLLASQAVVEDHMLSPTTASYQALILNNQRVMTVEAAAKVKAFAAAGLPVIVIGPTPNETYPATVDNQNTLATTMADLMSGPNVYPLDSANGLLNRLTTLRIRPRSSLDCTSDPVLPVWRSDAENKVDYVFFYNDQPRAADCGVTFYLPQQVTPYIYDAWTGTKDQLLPYTTRPAVNTPGGGYTVGGIDISLHLESNETMIIALLQSPETRNGTCSITSTDGNVRSLTRANGGWITANILGPATIQSSSGKTWILNPSLPNQTDLTTWDLSIEDWHASENLFDVKTSITIHNFSSQTLVPWTQLGPGFANVSGVGHYSTTFRVPRSFNNTALGGILNLGPVIHTARAFIDGELLPPIDPSNPSVDISNHIKPGGQYKLEVEVTTPLFNRVKSMANEIMIWGNIASVRQPLYAQWKPQEYGLVGPVTIQWTSVQQLEGSENCSDAMERRKLR